MYVITLDSAVICAIDGGYVDTVYLSSVESLLRWMKKQTKPVCYCLNVICPDHPFRNKTVLFKQEGPVLDIVDALAHRDKYLEFDARTLAVTRVENDLKPSHVDGVNHTRHDLNSDDTVVFISDLISRMVKDAESL